MLRQMGDPVMLFRREPQPGLPTIQIVPVPVPAVNRFRVIEPQFQSHYDTLLSEPVPEQLIELIHRFEDATATMLAQEGPRDGKAAPTATGRARR